MTSDIAKHFFAISELESESQVLEYLSTAVIDDERERKELFELWRFQRQADANRFLERPEDWIDGQLAKHVQQSADIDDTVSAFQIFPGYDIIRVIGRGGMAIVFEGRTKDALEKSVAIKWLRGGRSSPFTVQRFENECRLLKELQHPNIVQFLDSGKTTLEQRFLVTELIQGESISNYSIQGHVTLVERLKLMEQVCRAVEYSHAQGIIHRDIKPSNILIDESSGTPVPKLIDFGLAKKLNERDVVETEALTQHGQILGTPQYMSPQQAKNGAAVDVRNDVYSLGAVLFELAAGVPPVSSTDIVRQGLANIFSIDIGKQETLPSAMIGKSQESRDEAQDEPSDFTPEWHRLCRDSLDGIVLKAMAASPAQRYESVDALRLDIVRALEGKSISIWPIRMRAVMEKVGATSLRILPIIFLVAVTTYFATNFFIKADRKTDLTPSTVEKFDARLEGLIDLHYTAILFRNEQRLSSLQEILTAVGINPQETDASRIQLVLNTMTDEERNRLHTFISVSRWLNSKIRSGAIKVELEQLFERLDVQFPQDVKVAEFLKKLEATESSDEKSRKELMSQVGQLEQYQLVLICVALAQSDRIGPLFGVTEIARNKYPSNYDLQIQLGMVTLGVDPAIGEPCFTAAYTLRENSLPATVGLSLLVTNQGQFQKAMNYLSKAKKLNSGFLELDVEETFFRFAMTSSEKDFLEVKKQAERYPDLPLAIDRYAVAYRLKGDNRAAKEQYEVLIKKQADEPQVFRQLGSVCVELKDWKRATEAFAKAAELTPIHPMEFYHQYAYSLQQQRKLSAAEEVLRRGLAQKEDTECIVMLGHLALARGKDLEAIRFFKRALELTPDRVDVLNSIAPSLIRTERVEEALEVFLALVRVEPEISAHWYNLSVAYRKLERVNNAMHPALVALRLDEDAELHALNVYELTNLFCEEEGLPSEAEAIEMIRKNFPEQNTVFRQDVSAPILAKFAIRDPQGQKMNDTVVRIRRKEGNKIAAAVVVGDSSEVEFKAFPGEEYVAIFEHSVAALGTAPSDGSEWNIGPVIGKAYSPPLFVGATKRILLHNTSNTDVFCSLFHPDSGDQYGRWKLKPNETVELSIIIGDDWGLDINGLGIKALSNLRQSLPEIDQEGTWRIDLAQAIERIQAQKK